MHEFIYLPVELLDHVISFTLLNNAKIFTEVLHKLTLAQQCLKHFIVLQLTKTWF